MSDGLGKNWDHGLKWLGVKQKFFNTTIIADNPFSYADINCKVPDDSLKIVAQTTANLRTVFPASLSQMPHREVFLSKFGEVDVEELDHMMVHKICKKLMALVTTLEPLLMYWKNSFLKLNLEDERRV